MHGGIFIYPALSTPDGANGKLRFLYEVNPMGLLIERAGGQAIAGGAWLKNVKATSLHQRVPLALGSSEEVRYLRALYQ
jgi:fructose-1,6-bisphosphatase I